MADTKDNINVRRQSKTPRTTAKPQKLTAEQKARDAEEAKRRSTYLAIAVIIAVMLVVGYVLLELLPSLSGVSFQTFKQNFNAAPRIAIAVTYVNESSYVSEVPCFTNMLEIIGRTRNASTIDMLIMNKTTCTYSPSGLGRSVNIKTANASSCLGIANSEPSVFLNFTAENFTTITPYHMYVSGNGQYFAKCNIAAEFG